MLWLDVTASRARYGRWVEGTLPTFVPFQRTTRARTRAQRDAAAAAEEGAGGNCRAPKQADDGLLIRMRRLRCASFLDG